MYLKVKFGCITMYDNKKITNKYGLITSFYNMYMGLYLKYAFVFLPALFCILYNAFHN